MYRVEYDDYNAAYDRYLESWVTTPHVWRSVFKKYFNFPPIIDDAATLRCKYDTRYISFIGQ